jgi:malate dehydrogenase (oxaloacetate-decarboxylating)
VKAAGSRMRDQKIVFLGAGSASIGVADYLRAAMREDGLSDQEARDRFWIVDKDGLLHDRRTDLTPEQRIYQRSDSASLNLSEVIHNIDATILIGLSTAPGAFTESIVREMASKTARPIIFPLSNPTARSEAIPSDLLQWTNGRALIATGSPFPGVAQCNNVYIFPAIGLAAVASRARRVTDGMLLTAARALADSSPGDPLLPALHDLRSVTARLAFAVAQEAQRSGVADQNTPEALQQSVAATQWLPEYPAL